MRAVAVLLMMVAGAALLGLAQTLISRGLCPEYFIVHGLSTIGVAAVLGVVIGIPLSIAARVGRRPLRRPQSLLRPICVWMIFTGLGTLVGSFLAWNVAASGGLKLSEPLASQVPQASHAAFIALDLANVARNLLGGSAGAVMVLLVWRSREYGTGPQFARR